MYTGVGFVNTCPHVPARKKLVAGFNDQFRARCHSSSIAHPYGRRLAQSSPCRAAVLHACKYPALSHIACSRPTLLAAAAHVQAIPHQLLCMYSAHRLGLMTNGEP